MRVRTRIAAVAAAPLLAGAVSGCAASDVRVAYTDATATVPVGSQLVVDFGEINSSVGDEWVVSSSPDSDVLVFAENRSEYLGEVGSTGGSNTFAMVFDAVEPGVTTIEFEYQFRGAVPEDAADRENVELIVTVE